MKEQRKIRLILERYKCIGCGYCALLCPEHFEMAEDGKANLKAYQFCEDETYSKITIDSEEIENAILACPVNCIKKEKAKDNGH